MKGWSQWSEDSRGLRQSSLLPLFCHERNMSRPFNNSSPRSKHLVNYISCFLFSFDRNWHNFFTFATVQFSFFCLVVSFFNQKDCSFKAFRENYVNLLNKRRKQKPKLAISGKVQSSSKQILLSCIVTVSSLLCPKMPLCFFFFFFFFLPPILTFSPN